MNGTDRRSFRTDSKRNRLRHAVTGAALVFGVACSPAAAGQYVHSTCQSGQPGADNWSAIVTTDPVVFPGTYANNTCADGGGLHAELTPVDHAAIRSGQGAGWAYQAPADTAISAVSLRALGWVNRYYGADTEVRISHDGGSIRTFGIPGTFDDRITRSGLSSRSLQAQLVCATTCQTVWNLGWMAIQDPAVTLTDDQPPASGAPVTGSLLSDNVLSGWETVRVEATDRGGGIRQLELWSGDTRVWEAQAGDQRCAPLAGVAGSWVVRYAQPCPLSAVLAFGIDTSGLREGLHRLSIRLVDIAGNSTTVGSFDRTVSNRPPVSSSPPSFTAPDQAASPQVGDTLGADPGTWSGPDLKMSYQWQRCAQDGSACSDIPDATALAYTPTAADTGRRLRLVVTARNSVAVSRTGPLTGIVRSDESRLSAAGAMNGRVTEGGTCPEDAVVLSTPALRDGLIRARYSPSRSMRVRVVLSCAADGRPIHDALLLLSTRIPGQVSPTGGMTKTDRKGSAVLVLPASASREVTVSYRLRDGDERPRATFMVRSVIRGRVTLSVRQRGPVARFRGRLAGGRVPGRGVVVQLQWRDGQRWRPVANLKTDRHGRFGHTYRFSSRARGFRYAFRAVVSPGQTDYPFLPARSVTRRAGLR